MEYRSHGGWLIVLTLLLALALSIYPLPVWARWGRPDWPVMMLFYWITVLPHRVGIGAAWVTGLMLDILHGTTLGQHAFALAVIGYFTQISYQRMRMFSYLQQSVMVGSLVALHVLLYQWVQNLLGIADVSLWMLVQALISALLWLPVRTILYLLHARFAVN